MLNVANFKIVQLAKTFSGKIPSTYCNCFDAWQKKPGKDEFNSRV